MSSTFWLIAFSQDCYYLNIQHTNLILGKLSIFTGLGIALKNLSLSKFGDWGYLFESWSILQVGFLIQLTNLFELLNLLGHEK